MTFALIMCMTMIAPRSTLAFSIPGCRADNGAETKHHRTFFQRLLWLAAGSGAGHVAGSGGSAAVGVVKYRDDLTAGPRRFFKGTFKIAAPITASIVAGPAGAVGYAAVENRCWIQKHMLRHESPQTAPRPAGTAAW
jgi:hypothetical protein